MTLWGLLAESWPLAWPLPRVRDDIGEEGVAEALRLGLARRSALSAGVEYPCPRLCQMRLVDEDGLVAVCGRTTDRCKDERIAPADAFQVEVDEDTLVPVLQRLLRLPAAPPGSDRSAITLGTRRVWRRGVRFVLVPRPLVIANWIGRFVQEDPHHVQVLFTFTANQIPADARRRIEGATVEWVVLEEAFDGTGYLDLSDLWLTLGLAVLQAGELWPRYAFVVDEARDFWSYAGAELKLEGALEKRLLGELLHQAGRVVLRSDLQRLLWPESFNSGLPPNADSLNERLRQVKRSLSTAFKQLVLPRDAPKDPILSVRGRGDAEGGYRLDVEAERVLFVE